MNKTAYSDQQEEWLKILGKGLVTIPKSWREEIGLKPGKVVRAVKTGNKIVLEPQTNYAPIRTFTDTEIDQWLKDDQISPTLAKKIKNAGLL